MNNIILWREKIFFKVGKFYVLGNILTRQVYDCIILSRITDQKMKAAGKPIKKESNSFREQKNVHSAMRYISFTRYHDILKPHSWKLRASNLPLLDPHTHSAIRQSYIVLVHTYVLIKAY